MTRQEERAARVAIAVHEAGHAIAFAAMCRPPARAEASADGGKVYPPAPAPADDDGEPASRALAAAMALLRAAFALSGAEGVHARLARRPRAPWRSAAPGADRLSDGDREILHGAEDALRAEGICALSAVEALGPLLDDILARHHGTMAAIAAALVRRGLLEGAELDRLLEPVRGATDLIALIELAGRVATDPAFVLARPA